MRVTIAHVYRFDGEEWIPEPKLWGSEPVGPWPHFGFSVAINQPATTILVGAPYDRAMGTDAGAAYLFRYQDAAWQEIEKLLPSIPYMAGRFGWCTMSEDIGFIGEPTSSERPSLGIHVYAGLNGTDCNENGESDACDIFSGVSEDINGNGIPDECETIGDLDGDGAVDVKDLLILLAAWGPCGMPCPPTCAEDLNADCIVNVSDLLLLLTNWS